MENKLSKRKSQSQTIEHLEHIEPTQITIEIVTPTQSKSGARTAQPPASASETPFFEPLPSPRHIRLVDLLCTEEEIKTGYFTVSLDDAPKFFALSYTWGIPTQRDLELRMQAPVIPLTENLTNAMYILGTIFPGTYWIDALCINQQDNAEKSSQLTLMREIYSAAEAVMVFLGAKSEESDMACDLVGKLCKLFQNGEFDVQGEISPRSLLSVAKRYPFEDKKLRELGLPLENDPDWVALAELLSRPYFHRIWVLQELVMARGRIMVFCGSYQLPYDYLIILMQVLLPAGWRYQMMRLAEKSDRQLEMQALEFLPTVGTLRRVDGKKLDLEVLLDMVRTLSATDPRDKIFALLGMAKEVGEDQDMATLLQPDYSKSVQQVFTEVTGASLTRGDLVLLSSVERQNMRQTTGLPSWVPDFTATYHNGTFARGYAAGGESAVSAVWSPGCSELRIKAIVADTVGAIAAYSWDPLHSGNADLELVFLEAFISAARTFGRDGSDEFDWLALLAQGKSNIYIDAFWQTLVGYGCTIRRTSMAPDMRNHFATFIAKIFARPFVNQFQEMQQRLIAIPNTTDLLKMGDPGTFTAECVDRVTFNRFFFTKSHGYMGLATQDLQVGDKVMVFSGGSPIYIVREIRERKGYYRYIGDGYVWGLMDGQAVSDENHRFTEITLI
ncbi:heterokaryon incompatibility protein-domain-containing protein [Usnea florida]